MGTRRKQPPGIESVTIELDSVNGHIRRGLDRARREVDELAKLVRGVQEALYEVSPQHSPNEILCVTALAKAASGDLLSGAARLRGAAERVEAWAEIRSCSDLPAE